VRQRRFVELSSCVSVCAVQDGFCC